MRAPGQVQRGSGNIVDQIQQNSAKFPKKNPGSFNVKSGKIQQKFEKTSEKNSRKTWYKAKSGSKKVPEKAPEKIIGVFGVKSNKIQ